MTTPPARPHRWYSIALALLLLATLAVRFVALDLDPPYGIASTSGVFLTDEGWYSKSAQLYTRFGDWTSNFDFVWRSHNALYTLIQVALFKLLGISVFAIRGLTAASFVVAILSFYGICRTVQPRNVALVSCLLVSITMQVFAYSRMGIIDPVGASVCLLAMLAWVRGRGRWWSAPLSMAIIATAPFFKVSFLFGVVALALLNLGDAVAHWRRKDWKRAALTVVAIALAVGAIWVMQGIVNDWAARDARIFKQWHVDARVEGLKITSTIRNEISAIYHAAYATGAVVLTATLAFGAVFVMVKRRFPIPRLLGMSRATFGLTLLLLGGVSQFGLFPYQPPRYFFFAAFPIVYLTVMFVREASGQRHWRLVCLYLLFVHGSVQMPGYSEWLRRPRLYTYRDTIRDVQTRIERPSPDRPIVLMGKTASYISLYDERIRPINYNHHDELFERVEHWRPGYVFCLRDDAWFLRLSCRKLVRELQFIEEYPLLDKFYYGRPHILFKIVYFDDEPSEDKPGDRK